MSSDFSEGYHDRMTERIERALGGPEASRAYDYWGFGGGEERDACIMLDGGFTSGKLSALNAALAQAIDEEERWRCGIE